ncbi:opsin, ultraviolet-sensitive [Trichonephila inaurata madagascariensis]|uniref:Opsin, ultraviolet-sensitive n=1 Tax=Trichonephila inaurata madagascariensis TaxID=2747483 RepID=A0A8X6IJI1_9ARAC|nr:opsin, ultraviolet-sensitive [Trichonephila inaurata madagascariensis]
MCFFRTKRLRKPSNYLVINLALSDLLMLHKIVIFVYNSFSGGPAAGPFWCTYYGVIGGLSGTSAIMTIAMMAIERYVCVSRPLDPSSRMTRNRALIMVLSVWLYSAVFSFTPLFGLNRYVPEGFLTSCSFDYLTDELSSQIFVMSFFVAAWCVPMVIVCRCYVGIVLSVYENQQTFLHHAQNFNIPDRNVENQKRLEIKLAKISFALISMWTISWTPYAVVALLGLFTDRSLLTPLGSMLPALFCKLASVLDPFIYGLSNRQFKGELVKKLLTICRSRKLRDRQQMPSFIRRAMSIRSQDHTITEEHAEVSFSGEQCETALNGETFVSKVVESDPGGVRNVERNETSGRTFRTNQTSMCDPEMNNNVGLKSIHVIKIPQVYMIQTYSDVIKITSRRSF